MIRALARDTLIYGASSILSRGLSLLVLPIYTRILAPADYGALDMITVISSFALLLVGLEIAQALARFYAEAEGEAAKRQMASTALWFTAATFGIAGAVALAAAEPLAALLLGGAEMAGILRIGIAGIVANGFFYLVQNQLRFALRSGAYAMVSLVYSVGVTGLGIGLGYGFGLGLAGILWGLFAGTAVAALLGLWLLRGTYRIDWNGPLLRKMLAFSLPLVPSAVTTFLTLYSNRLFLNGIDGIEAVGLFGVAARVASIVALLILGLQAALTPLVYAHYKEPDTPRQLARITEQFTAFALAGCLALGLLAWELLALIADPSYMGAAPLVLFLAPATLVGQMYIFFPGIAIAKRTSLQFYIFAATALCSIVLNWLLIEAAGVGGAAVATLLSGLFFLGLWIWTSQRLYPLPIRWRSVGLALLLFATAAAGGLWLHARGNQDLWLATGKLGIVLLFLVGTVACGLLRPSELGLARLRGWRRRTTEI